MTAVDTSLEFDIKKLIIQTLKLEDLQPCDIARDAPLFGEGLGLDSIDALELGMALSRQYGIKLDREEGSTRNHFFSIKTLAHFVQQQNSPA